MKRVLEEKKQKKQDKKEKQLKTEKNKSKNTNDKNKSKNTNKKAKKPTNKTDKRSRVKRQVFEDSSDEENVSDKDLCDDNSDNEDETDLCFIYYDSGKSGRTVVSLYSLWSGNDTAKDYRCDFCLNKMC
ncbi:uncharacterized protein LOC114335079 isoform X2 [Diabrotica virgifera virgifera]|uniref:Uncharacterized protein n=1 Tax=Diabrotica virgifera virgifera TaxID=50390 RepID=A0ABM5JWQ7_DIAVI|nr:uncharacterized protein LOC114335079 isoform X2 [Diabrotica virgifera virgifera]